MLDYIMSLKNAWMIFVIALIVAVVSVTIFIVFLKKQKESMTPEDIEAQDKKLFIDPAVLRTEIHAKVIEQSCFVKMVGLKDPETVRVFNIVFETDKGDVLKFDVPEEMYHGMDVGQQGIVTFVDGDLYGFELD